MFDKEPDGAAPVDPEEAEALLPAHIHTRAELNLWEQSNILEATRWVERARTSAMSDHTIREVHRRMFDETWAWAGQYRTSDKNIGVHWSTISTEVRNLLADGEYWLAQGPYTVDEAAARLHHRLVKVHPFPNGNGRHARLWCDMVLLQNGCRPFDWKNRELDSEGEARRGYIAALRAADGNDYDALLSLLLRDR
jgi:Fic-DOC domain mobile mystery protein B